MIYYLSSEQSDVETGHLHHSHIEHFETAFGKTTSIQKDVNN